MAGRSLYRSWRSVCCLRLLLESCGAVWIPFYVKNDGELHFDKVPGCSCDAVQGTSKYRHKAVPDKSLDASFITGQRRTLAWFRGEE